MRAEDCVFETAAGQAGYFTAAQAHECGYSWALLSYHATNGRFIRTRRGLYRLRQYPSAPREEVVAAWLAAGPDAVVSHESALDLLDLADIIPDSIHVTVARVRRSLRRQPGVTLHTATQPPEGDEVVTRYGIRVTSAARTILDTAQSGVAPDQVVQAVRQALERGLVSRDRLMAAARDRGGTVERLIATALKEGQT
jgi:predicted transcriptional regulator of viral defense system